MSKSSKIVKTVKKIKSAYTLTAKDATKRAKKIASSRAINAKKGGMSVRMQRQMVKDFRIAMGETVSPAKYDLR